MRNSRMCFGMLIKALRQWLAVQLLTLFPSVRHGRMTSCADSRLRPIREGGTLTVQTLHFYSTVIDVPTVNFDRFLSAVMSI